MKNLENKNPGGNNGWTPLHSAAFHGRLNICEFIMKTVENKNPGGLDTMGWTPLHYAAQKGHLDVCKLFLKHIQEKMPKTFAGLTPAAVARSHGHFKVESLFKKFNY